MVASTIWKRKWEKRCDNTADPDNLRENERDIEMREKEREK